MKPDIFRTLIYSEPWHILKPWYIQNPVKYIRWSILFRTNILFYTVYVEPCVTLAYSRSYIFKPHKIESPRNTQKPVKHVWRAVFYRTLCNTGIFRTGGIFRTKSNIYDGKFYSQHCVIPAYSPKHLWGNILFKTLCNPDIFRNLVYSEIKAYSATLPNI